MKTPTFSKLFVRKVPRFKIGGEEELSVFQTLHAVTKDNQGYQNVDIKVKYKIN
jgi:hypothetical protein